MLLIMSVETQKCLPLEISVLGLERTRHGYNLRGYSFSNLGQLDVGDNLSANGETFYRYSYSCHKFPCSLKATKGRMRYNVEGGDQEVFYEFNIPPDPGAEGKIYQHWRLLPRYRRSIINTCPLP